MNRIYIIEICSLLLCSSFFVIQCSSVLPLAADYEPTVVFSGFINGNFEKLTGNHIWKNTCYLKSDTIRMCFYSQNFQEVNNIRDGDFLRIYLYPGSSDIIGTGRVLLHMARYHGSNSSYTVSPKDTLNNQGVVQMRALMLGEYSNEKVLLDEIYVRASPESGTTGALLEIKDGLIDGVIE